MDEAPEERPAPAGRGRLEGVREPVRKKPKVDRGPCSAAGGRCKHDEDVHLTIEDFDGKKVTYCQICTLPGHRHRWYTHKYRPPVGTKP